MKKLMSVLLGLSLMLGVANTSFAAGGKKNGKKSDKKEQRKAKRAAKGKTSK